MLPIQRSSRYIGYFKKGIFILADYTALFQDPTIIIQFQMQGIVLTDSQKQIWNDIGDTLSASLGIKHLALQYYLQYRESLMNNKVIIQEAEKINNIMRIAYFVSEKNQVTYNMKGEKVIGVALSINEIIKRNSDFEDFFLHLKEMLKVITIEDKEVQKQIETSLKKFKFTMTFHHKFVSTFSKLKPALPDANLTRSLLWLLFILTKQALYAAHDDIVQATCLMAASFIYYLKQALRYFAQKNQKQKMLLEDANFGGQLKSDIEIEHVMLEYFRIKDMNKFQQVEKMFYELVESLQNKIGSETFFFHAYERNLQTVYKKLDQVYQKKLTDQSIDERHFLKERINNVLNANRFTPFGGRRAVGKNKNPQPITQIFSHRILHYENDDSQSTKVSTIDKNQKNAKEARQKCGQNLLKNLVANKTPTRSTPLIRATPTTNAMQMYNWVLQKSSYHRYQPCNKDLPINLIMKGGRNISENFQDICKLIYGLWKDICDFENDRSYPNKKSSDAYLVLSVEIVYFVKNVNQNSLENLVKNFQLSWLDIWEKIDLTLKYDSAMPRSIKEHLLAVQTNIIAKQLWTMDQPPSYIFNQEPQTQNPDTCQRLYNRVIHELVYQIYFLSKKIPLIQEQQTNLIFIIAQYAIINHPQLLVNRNLYQIILCSFNVLARIHKMNLSFTSIVYPFVQLNGISKEYYSELIERIPAGNGESNKTISIVEFYNEIFIKATKQIAIMIKYEEGPINLTGGKVMNSSVKDLLPQRMVIVAEKRAKSTTPNTPTSLETPMTQALLAYNQSPLLKQKRLKNLMNCIDGKRLLTKKNKIEDEKTRQETLKQTKALINQKWKTSKSPDLRFGSTIRKTSATNQPR